MTARTDLENAFSILDAGITAHVSALKASRAAHAVTQAVADDETYLKSVTTKVLAWADALNGSAAAATVSVVEPSVAVATAAPVAPPPLPAFLTAPVVVVTPTAAPVAPVAAPVVAPVAPAAVDHVPSVAETMAKVVAMAKKEFGVG